MNLKAALFPYIRVSIFFKLSVYTEHYIMNNNGEIIFIFGTSDMHKVNTWQLITLTS